MAGFSDPKAGWAVEDSTMGLPVCAAQSIPILESSYEGGVELHLEPFRHRGQRASPRLLLGSNLNYGFAGLIGPNSRAIQWCSIRTISCYFMLNVRRFPRSCVRLPHHFLSHLSCSRLTLTRPLLNDILDKRLSGLVRAPHQWPASTIQKPHL